MAEAGPSRAGAVHASFAPAGQPDLVRAAQKDEFYVQACALSARHASPMPEPKAALCST